MRPRRRHPSRRGRPRRPYARRCRADAAREPRRHGRAARSGYARRVRADRPQRVAPGGAGRRGPAAHPPLALRRFALGCERLRPHVPCAVRRARGDPSTRRSPTGPGQERTKLIPHVTTALLEGRSPELSSGERLLDCVYAERRGPGVCGGRVRARGRGPHDRHRPRRPDVGARDRGADRRLRRPQRRHGRSSARVPVRALEQELERRRRRTAAALLGWRATTASRTGLRRTVALVPRRAESQRDRARRRSFVEHADDLR